MQQIALFPPNRHNYKILFCPCGGGISSMQVDYPILEYIAAKYTSSVVYRQIWSSTTTYVDRDDRLILKHRKS
ncbi:hypothetical protein C7B77_27545 [Chamaesiphon polymorphus CCALA 037]|uniref:Uncharacterized protein n=1 Tax=Chamaesiphon polymorphus CCALA 037 TaxID=2107692 RepID=A0A2T1F8F1_9CYAN|nr:hypothetical protein C7B77_27545 [Chamaesiphon polymorphus CCALA 037]